MVCFEKFCLFRCFDISSKHRTNRNKLKVFVFCFTKQTESQPKQILFRFVSVRRDIFVYVSRTPSARLYCGGTEEGKHIKDKNNNRGADIYRECRELYILKTINLLDKLQRAALFTGPITCRVRHSQCNSYTPNAATANVRVNIQYCSVFIVLPSFFFFLLLIVKIIEKRCINTEASI